jgi:glucose/mannose-6-phosphate isomerase
VSGDALTRERIEAVDSERMLDDVLSQVLQLGDALWRVQSAGLKKRDLPRGLAVCGMGGSAVGGDLALAILGDRATRPLRTVRDYALEPWAGAETLVMCSSYSGDTEETLACFEAAGIVGAPRVAVTTGGRLAETARAEEVPVVGIPAGMQPRAAVLYGTIAAIECAALCGAAPQLHTELDAATVHLERLVERWGPDSPEDSLAKRLATDLQGTLPVITGSGLTAPLARRWKTQLNENPNLPAFWSELPEADHNEICGWERGSKLAPASAVFLADSDQHPRLRKRIELTCREVESFGGKSMVVESEGETRLERVLSLLLLGDLMSVYLAVLDGVDPTPVKAIDRFKEALAETTGI